jgi:hypothetical protein
MSQIQVAGTVGESPKRRILSSMKCLSFKQIVRIVQQSEKEPWGECFFSVIFFENTYVTFEEFWNNSKKYKR